MEELIRNTLNGDKHSFEVLIDSVKSDLYRVAQAKLSNIDDINDAIQETITKTYSKLHTLKEPKFFRTWIIKILINECNIIYRKKYKQFKLFSKLSISKITDNNSNPFNVAEDKIDFDILLNYLNEKERLILALYFNSKYTPDEISNILSINVNTIKSIIYRAKEKLRKYLEKEELDNESRK